MFLCCQKQFTKLSVYDAHLTAKKHIKAQKKLDEEQNVSQPKTVQLNGDKRKVIFC